MNKVQLSQVIAYIDAEYAGIAARMSNDEKKIRARHWASEVGALDFDAVMGAVRKLARGQYMPRTAEVISEVEKSRAGSRSGRSKCRIYRDPAGHEILDLRHPDGSDWICGDLSRFPEWMQLQFRWMADPSPENTAAWDAYISAHEERDKNARAGLYPMCDALMATVGGAG